MSSYKLSRKALAPYKTLVYMSAVHVTVITQNNGMKT